ncbi:hypothetical protein [Planobispora rosea]|nr:hypothetical protein [Planobispora rosea]
MVDQSAGSEGRVTAIGTIPPDEYEALYYAQHHPSEPAGINS